MAVHGTMSTMDVLTLRCYGDLAELAGADRDGLVRVPMGSPRALLDVVQSTGVPHTEVDLVVVDGRSVGWDHQAAAGQRAAVYPPFSMLPAGVVSRVRPHPPRALRFAADAHLAALADALQDLGADIWLATHVTQEELVARATEDARVLLSRDRRPLMHPRVLHGVLLRSTDPREQLLEVACRHDLATGVRSAG